MVATFANVFCPIAGTARVTRPRAFFGKVLVLHAINGIGT
jgi:hypothetical protein